MGGRRLVTIVVVVVVVVAVVVVDVEVDVNQLDMMPVVVRTMLLVVWRGGSKSVST